MLCLSTVQSLNNLERDDTEACAAVKDAVSGAAAIVCLCGEDAHLALDRCCKTIETLPSTLLNGECDPGHIRTSVLTCRQAVLHVSCRAYLNALHHRFLRR